MAFDINQSAVPAIDHEKCVRCGACVSTCPSGYLHLQNGQVVAQQSSFMPCIGCGQCSCVCPQNCIAVNGRRFDPGQVVEIAKPDLAASPAQLDALMLKRRSVRKYRQVPVEAAKIEQILAAVATAPMGIPPSPVGIAVIDGLERVQTFAEECCQSFERSLKFMKSPLFGMMRLFFKAAAFRFIQSFALPLLDSVVTERKQGRDILCYNAPLALLFHEVDLGEVVDSTIATTYAMLAAEAAGLGSCWIGSVAVLNQDKALKARYRIPADHKITGLLLCGYADVLYRRSVRRKLAGVEYFR